MSLQYIECPTEYAGSGVSPDARTSIFLAGGITGCPDWQAEVVTQCREDDWANKRLTLINPRRKSFKLDDPTLAEAQIRWEHRMLRVADVIVFWFPEETVCPIALYELGAWSMTTKTLILGAHPNYSRRFDVVTQTALARPTLFPGPTILSSLSEVIDAILHPRGRT
jgi:hypothetical protein